MQSQLEVWQRGPVENIPGLLQPVAHALLQAREEVNEIMGEFPEKLLWQRPGGVASPAFHLQHLTGVLNRLFTYAKQAPLTEEQLHALSIEGKESDTTSTMAQLIDNFDKEVDRALEELSKVNQETLLEARGVGRKQIPTTLIGLYVHAAEHTMRHIGQLLVTARIIKSTNN